MLKRNTLFFLLLTLLMAVSYTNANAQFWKKKQAKQEQATTTDSGTNEGDDSTVHKSKRELRREKKKQHKEEVREQKKAAKQKKKEAREQRKHKKDGSNTSQPPVIVNQWANIPYPASQKKSGYRIEVLAPIYLDELVKSGNVTFKENIPEKAVAGLNFYIGVGIAADSLKKALFDMDIYMHDVASASESVEKLVKNNLLDSADLIIGAVSARDVPMLAEYAQKRNINFVSVTSPLDGGVKYNPFFTMLQPSLRSHCEWIDDELIKKPGTKRPILLYRTAIVAEDNAFRYLTEKNTNQYAAHILCNSLPNKATLAKYIDTARENELVVGILDTKFTDSLLKMLGESFPHTHFVIYGMPTWSTSNLQKTHDFPNIVINITAPFYANPDVNSTWYVSNIYKKEYGGNPHDMVYRGFETLIWYANMLKRYGTVFNSHYEDNETAPFTKFEVKPQWDAAGSVLYLENRHVVLRKYDSKTAIVK